MGGYSQIKMANITQIEKSKLEKILLMEGGYVLDFSNSSFDKFIKNSVNIDIYRGRYESFGTSKANHLQSFWQQESDGVVGKLLEEMLSYLESKAKLNSMELNVSPKLFEDCMSITYRLQGKKTSKEDDAENINETLLTDNFLKKEVEQIHINSFIANNALSSILEMRVAEIKKCLDVEAPLAAIFLIGSVLEGIFLYIATKYPEKFNQTASSPKHAETGEVLKFQDWSLSYFMDAASEAGIIGSDVKKYGHLIRDFRNYIHPNGQINADFNADMNSAKICWQVLKIAMKDIYQKLN